MTVLKNRWLLMVIWLMVSSVLVGGCAAAIGYTITYGMTLATWLLAIVIVILLLQMSIPINTIRVMVSGNAEVRDLAACQNLLNSLRSSNSVKRGV